MNTESLRSLFEEKLLEDMIYQCEDKDMGKEVTDDIMDIFDQAVAEVMEFAERRLRQ